ncbi:glycosyltransferase, partial [Candidatus Woesearchaeota archaeon]|nr:glycosyltransferase [Candidatus Woesearchaeota archaeon]
METAAVLISLSTIIGFYNFFTATKLTKSRSRHQPFISVLIPARNEENNLPQLLQSLLKQTYPHFEVIIC